MKAEVLQVLHFLLFLTWIQIGFQREG